MNPSDESTNSSSDHPQYLDSSVPENSPNLQRDKLVAMAMEFSQIAQQVSDIALQFNVAISQTNALPQEFQNAQSSIQYLEERTSQLQNEVTQFQLAQLSKKGVNLSGSVPGPSSRPQIQAGAKKFKINATSEGQIPRWQQYADWIVGRLSWRALCKYELLTTFLGSLPGAMGYFLRGKIYPRIFGSVGKNVVFGRSLTIRHPHKIHIGNHVVFDDYAVLDAKGQYNVGIIIQDGVFVGRHTIIFCKDGNIDIQANTNIGPFCMVYSSNHVVIGPGCMVGAYSYIMSGGSYDLQPGHIQFAKQEVFSKGPVSIGEGCWLGAKVVVLDGVNIGDRTVVGAGSVVTKHLSSDMIAVGLPAKCVAPAQPLSAI